MCCLPTGSGKTALAVFAAWQALMRGGFSTIQKGPSKSSQCCAFLIIMKWIDCGISKEGMFFWHFCILSTPEWLCWDMIYLYIFTYTHTFDRASLGTPDVARFFALSWSMGSANSFVSEDSTALGNLGPQRWRLARTSCWFFKWDVFIYIYTYLYYDLYICVCVQYHHDLRVNLTERRYMNLLHVE